MKKGRAGFLGKGVLAILGCTLVGTIIGATYARYSSTIIGDADVPIAEWAVKVNEKNPNENTSFDLTFDIAQNNDTVSGKIAPGGTATAYVEVDLSGTEVSVDYNCELVEHTPDNDCYSVTIGTPIKDEMAENMTVDANNKVIRVGTAAMEGKVRVPITLTWEDKNTEDGDLKDTTLGVYKDENGESVAKITVNLTVKQHISQTASSTP